MKQTRLILHGGHADPDRLAHALIEAWREHGPGHSVQLGQRDEPTKEVLSWPSPNRLHYVAAPIDPRSMPPR
ncbi:MAG TPA: hypothetical protein VFA48_02555 [Gammaproteobacteria bacterium]|nr:hypothetical protein [Gammaproteobacteria bacterium]